MHASLVPSGVITLLTDFGLSEPFVGVMTGAIISRFPAARVVDLCHGIPAQAISEAAFWLERCHPWFPPGTVHVAVIDPGVGTQRRIVAAALLGHYFLVPDNGLLGQGLLGSPGARVHAVDLERLGLDAPSATFHGRDIFAPLAALLASGEQSLDELGPPVLARPCLLAPPLVQDDSVSGQVISVDRFGNLITNIDASLALRTGAKSVSLAGRQIPLCRTYSDVEAGELLALVNAFSVIEVAEREGSAERRLGVGRGCRVELAVEHLG
jgi:S-adenosyl-L-methionine hydrolase (adenosine-forming)